MQDGATRLMSCDAPLQRAHTHQVEDLPSILLLERSIFSGIHVPAMLHTPARLNGRQRPSFAVVVAERHLKGEVLGFP